MIIPLVIFDFVLKLIIIIEPIADIDDEIILSMFRFQVLDYMIDIVSVSFLEDGTGREGHCNDTL